VETQEKEKGERGKERGRRSLLRGSKGRTWEAENLKRARDPALD